MAKQHAKLSASGAHRWMNCPGSVALEERYPDQSSEFAEEGTRAHEYAELALTRGLAEAMQYLDVDNKVPGENKADLLDAVTVYHDYVTSLNLETVQVERRVDFSPWVPGGFGTADCYGIKGDHLYVIDFKYGKGVRVNAENNPQARLYALGVLNKLGFLYDIERATLVIVQPRLDHISEETINV